MSRGWFRVARGGVGDKAPRLRASERERWKSNKNEQAFPVGISWRMLSVYYVSFAAT